MKVYGLFFLMLILINSCGNSPETTLGLVNNAAKEKDLSKYLDYFTDNSQKLIKELIKVDKETKGTLRYFKDPFTILPEGKILETKTDDEKNVAWIKIKEKGGVKKITMVKEGGKWTIDLTLLDSFYDGLKL
jgi:hypothetical protein